MFPLLWIIAELFHLISSAEIPVLWSQGQRFYPAEQILLFCLSIAYLIRGHGRSLFILILALQILGTILSLPVVPNHCLLATVLNVVLLWSCVRNGEQLSEESRAVCRTGALILYFFAGFHKLNSSYLDPDLSCATSFYGPIARDFPFLALTPALMSLLPIMSIVIELAIPCLLLGGRTSRLAGILLGALFHFGLALNIDRHFFDFSSMMWALLFLFQSSQTREERYLSLPWRLLLGAGFALALAGALGYPDRTFTGIYLVMRMRVWAVFAVIFFVLLARILLRKASMQSPVKIFPGTAGGRAVAGLLLVNGAAPYLGLKTRSAFDMYSNLRVEEGVSNHLLIPGSALGGIYTDDLVHVTRMHGAPVRFEIFDPERRMVRFELASLLLRTPGLEVTIKEADNDRVIRSAQELYPDGHPPSGILRKLLWFRPVEMPGQPNRCQW